MEANNNNIVPDEAPSAPHDNTCINMLYTLGPPTPEEQEQLSNIKMCINFNFHTQVPINHSFYNFPSLRPPREPQGEEGWSVWDRIQIPILRSEMHRSHSRTGIIMKITEATNENECDMLHIHFDDKPDNYPRLEEHVYYECYLIPWPQHEGRVHQAERDA